MNESMRKAVLVLVLCNLACRSEKAMKGVLLEDLTWLEAEKVLTPDAIVVIPLGAASKEHGPHLRLDNDRVLAEYFRDRLLEEEEVIAAPVITHHFYPAFVEYPGSITLRLETARDLVQQVMLLTIEKLRSGSVRDGDQIASFVLGVSRTMVKDLKRLEWRRERLRNAFMAPHIVEAPAEDATLDVDRLERCLARLAERERMVILLTFYAERTASDVGKELEVKEGHVRVIRHRAIERLRTCMTAREVVQ